MLPLSLWSPPELGFLICGMGVESPSGRVAVGEEPSAPGGSHSLSLTVGSAPRPPRRSLLTEGEDRPAPHLCVSVARPSACTQ